MGLNPHIPSLSNKTMQSVLLVGDNRVEQRQIDEFQLKSQTSPETLPNFNVVHVQY